MMARPIPVEKDAGYFWYGFTWFIIIESETVSDLLFHCSILSSVTPVLHLLLADRVKFLTLSLLMVAIELVRWNMPYSQSLVVKSKIL